MPMSAVMLRVLPRSSPLIVTIAIWVSTVTMPILQIRKVRTKVT